MKTSQLYQYSWRSSVLLTAGAIIATLIAPQLSKPDAPLRWTDVTELSTTLLLIAGVLLAVAVLTGLRHSRTRQENEDMFRSLVESAKDAMFTSDATGRYLYVNPAGAARLGKTQAEVIGQLVDEFFPPATATHHREAVQQALRTGESSTNEVSFELDGRRVWVSVLLQPVRDPDGGYTRALAISRDITDLKRAEAALRESEERLRQVIRLSHIGIFDHNHLTGSIYWSPEQRQIYGWGPDEPVVSGDESGQNRQTWDLVHPLDRERTAAAIRHAHAAEDGLFDIEYRIVLPDGTVRWVSTRAQTFFAGTGSARRPVQTIGAVLDITERKRAERQLLLAQTSIDKSSVAIFWVNPSGEVTYANEEACASLGRGRSELLGRHVWEFDPDFRSEDWAKAWKQLRTLGSLRGESRHCRPDGSTFPVEITGSYVVYEGEEQLFVFVQDITERHRTERDLQLLKTAIDTSHTSFYSISPQGQIAYANEHAARSLGVPREKLIGSHVWDFDPDFSPQHQPSYWQEVKKGGLLRFETHHRRADGTLMPVEVTSNYFSFKGEEYSLALAQDITERKRAEEELALFRHCADRSSDGIFWSNIRGGFDYVNDQACRSLGYTREELLSLNFWDLDDIFPEERWPALWEKWQSAPEELIWRTLSSQRRKDGTTFPIEAMAQHIRTSGGRSLHVAYVRDITERKKAEQALRESEERLRQVAMVYNIGVFDHDHVTDTTYWSPELRECLGLLSTEPAATVTFRRIIHPDDLEMVETAIQRALDPAGDGRYSMQHRIVSSDGSVKWLDTRSKTFFGGESGARHPTRTVGAMVEITDRMRAQETLRESVREKETLLREVHHRVKNNLQIISSLLHFQAKKVRDPEDLVVFNEGRNRLRAMILVHERLYQSSGLAQIDFGSYLQALVKDLWHSYAAAVGGRICVHVKADSVALPIEAALPCGMIVCELLTNSIKYAFPAESSGQIHVALTGAEECVTLTVSDDGIGLPPDFDPARERTFGWQLIRNLAAQLGASLTTSRGPGAQVVLQFRGQSSQS